MNINQAKLEELMLVSLKFAESSLNKGNSPFGCVLADADGNILVQSENTTNTDNNPIAHAEINAILALARKQGVRKFKDVVLVSSVQSCPMCFAAAYRSGIRTFVYGCAEDDTLVPRIDVHTLNKYCNPRAEIVTGVLQHQCAEMLKKARQN